MTQSPGDPETQFSELLARFDEELAATPDASSITSRAWVASGNDASLQRRLDRVQNCLRLLDQDRRRLSATNSNTATGAGFHSGLSIASPDDLKGTPRQIGRFQLIRRLGSGGFGVVFLAEDPTLKRLVAVKIPRPETLATPDLQARFIRESQLAARVTHPHLVPVYEAGQAGPVSYQVTAYCAGGNLSQWLRKAEILASPDVKSGQNGAGNPAGGSASQHSLPIKVAVELMIALATGVQHAHEHGILHRDLKPSNILLYPKGESGDAAVSPETSNLPLHDLCSKFQPMIADFGLAKLLNAVVERAESSGNELGSDITKTQLAGTPQYMAPEQVTCNRSEIGPPTDVYGLGAILYEVLAGRPVFLKTEVEAERSKIAAKSPIPPRQLRPEIPLDLEAICLKCLEKETYRRYPSAADLVRDLLAFQRGEAITARPWPWHEQLSKWSKRHPAVAGLLTLTMCLMLGLLGFTFWHVRQLGSANLDLRHTVAQLEHQTMIAETERARAAEQTTVALKQTLLAREELRRSTDLKWIARQREYSASMIRAGGLFAKGETGQLSSVLKQFQPPPQNALPESDVRDFPWHYLWHQSQHLLELHGHLDEVLAVVRSPDQSRAFSYGDDGTLREWETESGKLLRTIVVGEQARPVQAKFSLDATRAIVLRQLIPGNQYELSIWELATGKTLHRFLTSARVVETVAISPNGAWAVYGGGGRETPDAAFLELIDIRTGHRSVVEFSAKNDFASNGMTAMAISPDGNELCIALSSADDGISWQHRLLSTRLKFSSRTKQEQPADAPIPPGAGDWRNLSVLRTGLGTDLEYSQDGQHIAFALWNPQKVEIWNAASGTLAASRDLLSDDFDAFAFEKDDQLVIAGNFATKSIENSGTIVNQTMSSPPALLQWDWRSNKLQTSKFPAPVDISCLQYSVPHESWIIGFVGGRLNVWRPGTIEPFTELSGHQPKECWGVAFSPDSHRIYSVGDDACLNVWDTTNQGLITRRQQQTQLTSCVAVSPDGRWIATGSYDNTVVVWQAESLNVQYTLSGHTRAVRTIAFSPDSMTLASSGRDGNVCIWNMSDGTLKVTHHDDDSTIRAVEFYAEDALVNVNAKGRIAARSLQSGQQVLRNEGQEVHSLAIAPSGTLIPVPPLFAGQHPNSPILKAAAGDLLLYGEKFGPFKLLHVPTRSLWLEQHYPGTDIRSLAFTPDGRTFAVAGDDHAVHLWHVASGQEVLTFSDLPAAVNQVAFSPDGQHLAAALHDGTIRIWHAPQ